nr:transposase [Turicimonas muris]
MLWGDALWAPSYFAASCGGAPISIIKHYIESVLSAEQTAF